MKIHWKLFVDCNTNEAARKLASRHFALLSAIEEQLTVEPYHKGGFVVSVVTMLLARDWSEGIVEALSQAQIVGRAWVLNGDITHELDIWSNESPISGINSVHLYVSRV